LRFWRLKLNRKVRKEAQRCGVALQLASAFMTENEIGVENRVIVEVKSVEALNDVHLAQILTYLKLSRCKLGFLINFNVKLIKEGIKRVVNNL
jgi:GxxExxY protein